VTVSSVDSEGGLCTFTALASGQGFARLVLAVEGSVVSDVIVQVEPTPTTVTVSAMLPLGRHRVDALVSCDSAPLRVEPFSVPFEYTVDELREARDRTPDLLEQRRDAMWQAIADEQARRWRGEERSHSMPTIWTHLLEPESD
jgi:hypothetical protein